MPEDDEPTLDMPLGLPPIRRASGPIVAPPRPLLVTLRSLALAMALLTGLIVVVVLVGAAVLIDT